MGSGRCSGRTIKGLPLWQPWATLVAIGAKQVETRHWPAPTWLLGQRVAIYATKTTRELGVCMRWPFVDYVPDHRILPLGALVATVVLDRCTEMTTELISDLAIRNPVEHAFGHYAPGRFAWVLRDVEQLPEPVPFAWPAKGPAKFIDVPADLVGVDLPQGALL